MEFILAPNPKYSYVRMGYKPVDQIQMCRRFSQYFSPEAREFFEGNFGIILPDGPLPPPMFNVPPFSNIQTVLPAENHARELREVLWGLIPSFAREFAPHPKIKMDLTRVESFSDRKDDFRKDLLKTSRCVVPVNNYFEWETVGKQKLPYKIQLKDAPMMALGAIYDVWQDSGGEKSYSCSIITLPANRTLAKIHPRMPFVLEENTLAMWLDASFQKFEVVRDAIQRYPDDGLACCPVSTKVNKVVNDYPELLEPLQAHENVQGDLFK